MQRQRTPPTSACQPPSFEKRGRFAELFQKAPRQGPIPEVPPRSLADPPPSVSGVLRSSKWCVSQSKGGRVFMLVTLSP